jgi:membrane protease YdiL (CAAX protease family)
MPGNSAAMPPFGTVMTLASDRNQTPPWGMLATIAWLLAAFAVSALVTLPVLGAVRPDLVRSPGAGYDGVLVALGVLASVPVQIAVLALAARLRQWQPERYLAINLPRRGEWIFATICVLALNLAFNAILYLTGHDIVTPFQVETYRSAKEAGWLFWLLVAIVVIAPAGEEIAFRGFLYRGLAHPGRELHAIAAIALVWALLHIQYDWLGMVQIFAAGLMLGWFRWASGSTTLAVAMHVLINLEATIETAIKVEFLS